MPLTPESYFDLNGYKHRILFDDVAYVWEALGRISLAIEKYAQGLGDAPAVRGRVHAGAWIEGEVYIEPGAVVEPGAYIQGPAVIGAGAVIRHGAYIRGDCIIGRDCVVGHATELKNVIMIDEAHAPHFNYVGDSILGRRVNLGAGTRLSNFKTDGSLIDVVTPDGRIATGMRKLGAILGDGVTTGCNCVTSPGTLIGADTMIYPTAVVRGVIPEKSIVKLRQKLETARREMEA